MEEPLEIKLNMLTAIHTQSAMQKATFFCLHIPIFLPKMKLYLIDNNLSLMLKNWEDLRLSREIRQNTLSRAQMKLWLVKCSKRFGFDFLNTDGLHKEQADPKG